MVTDDTSTGADRAPRWVLLLAFVGFLLMIGAWSLAEPYEGAPDETQHAVRAAGVVAGQIAPHPAAAVQGTGAYQTVPAGLNPPKVRCWIHDATVNVSCARPPNADRTLVTVGTAAGRYPPLYYAAVGGPLRLWPGMPGLILARLISAAMAAGLLTASFAAIWRWSRFRLLAVGILIGFTPVAAQLAGSINPNGLEIVAGIALFTAGLPLFARFRRWGDAATDEPAAFDRRLLALFGVGAVLLTAMRASGPPWLLVALTALLFPFRPAVFRALWRDRAARLWCAGITAAFLGNVAWTLVMKTADLGNYRSATYLGKQQIVWQLSHSWRVWLDEAVAILAFMDAPMPGWVYLVWESLAAAVLIWAFVAVRGLERWWLVAGTSLAVLVPSALQFVGANAHGFVTQGRYLLPLLVGVVLIAADILERRVLTWTQARSLVRVCLVTLLPIHLFGLLVTMQRYQSGLFTDSIPRFTMLNPSRGRWHPVLGSWLPVILEILGLVIVAVVVSRSMRATAGRAGSDADRAAAEVVAVG